MINLLLIIIGSILGIAFTGFIQYLGFISISIMIANGISFAGIMILLSVMFYDLLLIKVLQV